jgi:hypothetical protein
MRVEVDVPRSSPRVVNVWRRDGSLMDLVVARNVDRHPAARARRCQHEATECARIKTRKFTRRTQTSHSGVRSYLRARRRKALVRETAQS